MSKAHSDLLRQHNGKSVASREEIWAKAEEVWSELTSAKIARAHILAFRIAKRVIKEKGSNKFLSDSGLHQSVRSDFMETEKGVVPKEK